MENKIIKIFTYSALFLLLSLKCSDNNIVNIYNKYTEHYRQTPEDKLVHRDSCITVKVISSYSNLPISNSVVVLTVPSNDTFSAVTNNEGIVTFTFPQVREGTYSVKTSLFYSGSEHTFRNTYYLNEKNSSALIIYINERLIY